MQPICIPCRVLQLSWSIILNDCSSSYSASSPSSDAHPSQFRQGGAEIVLAMSHASMPILTLILNLNLLFIQF